MAGSEQTGLHGADPDLFEGAVWVLTPTAATDLEAFNRLKGVVMSLGADVLVLSPRTTTGWWPWCPTCRTWWRPR